MTNLPPTFVPTFHIESEVRKMKYNNFGKTGLKVSQLSIGTAGFCLQYGDYTVAECKSTLHNAVRAGINYIDTAPWYGHGVSEDVVGKCLEGIPREAYYIATKVGRYEADPKFMFDFSAQKTRSSVETSLKKLGVDCIDLVQVHDFEFASSLDIIINETLPVLDEYVKNGKIKYIGVTSYILSILEECTKKSNINIDMVLSYSRLSLINNDLLEFLPYFQSQNLGIVNAAGNCMGLLVNDGPQPWHPAPKSIRDVCELARNYCKAKNVELAKLALYHCLKQYGPHTHLVGMNTNELLKSNLEVLHNGLSASELQVLNDIQTSYFSKMKCGQWETEQREMAAKIISSKLTE